MRARLDLRHPSPRSIAAISALLLTIATSGIAIAQSAEAEALFNDGDKLFKEHKLAEACDAFEASNRIEARAGTLIRLGECREQNNQLASAWSAYRDAQARAKDPRKLKLATDKVAELEPRLSHLTIAVPPDARIDGLALLRNGKPVDPGLWNRAIPIDGGDYTITANAPQHETWKSTSRVQIEHSNITITVKRLGELPKSEVPGPVAKAPDHPDDKGDDDDERRTPPSRFTTQRKVAIGVLAGGVGAMIVGIVLGESANSKQHDAYALCPDPTVPCAQATQANALVSAGHTRAYEADAGFAVGAVAAIVAGALWFTGSPPSQHERSTEVGVTAGAHGAGFVVTRRF